MNKITNYLKIASECYYAGSPIITDAVFDRLAQSVGYAEVGAKQHENIKKHLYQMYSLQKYYEDEGVAPLTEYKNKEATPKLDGAAISLLYVEGELVQVLTRGDGVEGTDVTPNFIARKDLVPLKTDHLGVYQVTGEIVAPKQVVNSRNYAAGALSLKDSSEFCTRSISFFAYSVFPSLTDTFREDMDELNKLGFETVYARDIHNIYPCDGLVIRINDNNLFHSLGYTSKHPRGAYALKERAEAVETQIISVEWNVGKSGKVTPVANLKPIYIGDKLVSRATLNNQRFIEELGICIGDTVGVVLNGEIIPGITHKVEA